jgi:hypothetical protein
VSKDTRPIDPDNPLGIISDDERDPAVINDIFQTDKDWEDWEKIKRQIEERKNAGVSERFTDPEGWQKVR